MSDDTLSQLVAESIAHNIAPLLKWLYAVFAAVIMGTAFLVGMWHDLKRDMQDAQKDATSALEKSKTHLEPMLHNHETRIVVLESRRKP